MSIKVARTRTSGNYENCGLLEGHMKRVHTANFIYRPLKKKLLITNFGYHRLSQATYKPFVTWSTYMALKTCYNISMF